MLFLKLLLTPLLIAAVTLVARRFGQRIGGLLLGLPLTSGPISVFLAMEHGARFAARAATGAIGGTIGVGTFCAAYAVAARRSSWPVALAAGVGAFAATVLALRFLPGSLAAVALVALATLGIISATVGRRGASAPARAAAKPPAWDLPLRMLVATTLVTGLTIAARALGPTLSGALSAVPAMSAVLAPFTHRREGGEASAALLAGVIGGALATVVFYIVVGTMMAPGTLASTYALATLAALAVNGIFAARSLGAAHALGARRSASTPRAGAPECSRS